MANVFFSYASEDRQAVDAVYAAVVEAYPDHEPWMDRYEIVAGNSLIEKIADGMDVAEKFFVFLSSTSVSKPWVRRELRRAIMREIDGLDSDYVVPVKLGDLTKVPAFLEDKVYIDLGKLRKEEWLTAFDAAIRGEPTRLADAGHINNAQHRIDYGPEGHHVAHVTFAARAWAEPFSFAVETSYDMIPPPPGPPLMEIDDILVGGAGELRNVRFHKSARLLALSFESPELRPVQPHAIR